MSRSKPEEQDCENVIHLRATTTLPPEALFKLSSFYFSSVIIFMLHIDLNLEWMKLLWEDLIIPGKLQPVFLIYNDLFFFVFVCVCVCVDVTNVV